VHQHGEVSVRLVPNTVPSKPSGLRAFVLPQQHDA